MIVSLEDEVDMMPVDHRDPGRGEGRVLAGDVRGVDRVMEGDELPGGPGPGQGRVEPIA